MNDSKNTSSGGIGFAGLLAIAFIVLKLTGVIGWPWVWVLAPIWISIVIIVLAAIIVNISVWFRWKQ